MGTSRLIISFSCWYSRAASHAVRQSYVIAAVSRLAEGPDYGQTLSGGWAGYLFSITGVFRRTNPFSILYPSHSSTDKGSIAPMPCDIIMASLALHGTAQSFVPVPWSPQVVESLLPYLKEELNPKATSRRS